MSSVLRQPALSPRPLTLGDPGVRVADPVVAAELEAAYQRGFEDGRARGLSEEIQRLQAAADTTRQELEAAVQAARRQLAEAAVEPTRAVLAVALDVAETIVGSLDPVATDTLTRRILDAVAALDDQDLVVAVHPARAKEVAAALADVPGISVQSDDALGLGDARLRGMWSRADLTVAAAFRNLREALDA